MSRTPPRQVQRRQTSGSCRYRHLQVRCNRLSVEVVEVVSKFAAAVAHHAKLQAIPARLATKCKHNDLEALTLRGAKRRSNLRLSLAIDFFLVNGDCFASLLRNSRHSERSEESRSAKPRSFAGAQDDEVTRGEFLPFRAAAYAMDKLAMTRVVLR